MSNPRTESRVELIPRSLPTATAGRPRRTFTLWLLLALGVLVGFGMITSEVSFAWLGRESEPALSDRAHEKLVAAVTTGGGRGAASSSTGRHTEPLSSTNNETQADVSTTPAETTTPLPETTTTTPAPTITTPEPTPTTPTPTTTPEPTPTATPAPSPSPTTIPPLPATTKAPVSANSGCSPRTVNVSSLLDGSTNTQETVPRFYAQLQRAAGATAGLVEPPVFHGDHEYLCTSDADRDDRGWSNCLPISGIKDDRFCHGADRRDLLVAQNATTRCFASVLHLMLTDVYALFRHHGGRPALLYGTMLGAIRDGGIIPFTEDVDLGYQWDSNDRPHLDVVRAGLWARGYHMFRDNIWRVCIAPTHPLARNLYNPRLQAPIPGCSGPYMDLYGMQKMANGQWHVQEARHGRRIADDKIVPYSPVRINGLDFDTVADPIDFLIQEYGADYMTPHRRPSRR